MFSVCNAQQKHVWGWVEGKQVEKMGPGERERERFPVLVFQTFAYSGMIVHIKEGREFCIKMPQTVFYFKSLP